MSSNHNQLFTPDEVADRLNLHVKTVRRYIRDGQLKSVRIGKRYRVTSDALNAFAGFEAEQTSSPERLRCEVSSIATLENVDQPTAMRIAKYLTAASQTHSEDSDQALLVETLHVPVDNRLKVIVSGSIAATSVVLDLVKMLTENGSGAQ